MIKRGILRTLGTTCYIGIPLAIASSYYKLLTEGSAGTQISFVVVIILIISLPILKDIKLPFSTNKLWLVILGVSFMFMLIAVPVMYISAGGVVGSSAYSLLKKKADKMLEEEKALDIATKVATNLEANKETVETVETTA